MSRQKKYKVILSEEVDRFLETLTPKAKNKILYNISLVEGGFQDSEIFKKLEGSNIWEFRTLYGKIKYRLLSFFDTESGALIITTHGFIKKTQKTPAKELERAEAIRKEYYKQKGQKL